MTRVFSEECQKALAALLNGKATKKQIQLLRETVESSQTRKNKLEKYYQLRAKEIFEDEGRIEVDEGACVSYSDDGGAYVMAWVWVYAPEGKD